MKHKYTIIMTPAQFERELAKKQARLRNYVAAVYPRAAGKIALRFIDGNFRAQGWQGDSFSPWKENKMAKKKKGRVLIKTGRGRRGTKMEIHLGEVRIYNDVPYMVVHNKGFSGTVNVKTHSRRVFKATKFATDKLTKSGKARMKTVHTLKGVHTVKAHTRKIDIPKRQFFPLSVHDSPVLANALRREAIRGMKLIFE